MANRLPQPFGALLDSVSEAERLRALDEYAILDTAAEAQFDCITRLAARICEMPIALISLVDAERQWFKSAFGLDESVRETPRDQAFCAHAIVDDRMLEVVDATLDPRFRDNPLVTGEPGIRHYAGQPLVGHEGHRLGTLCVIDTRPGRLTESQQQSLQDLSTLVMSLLEIRRRQYEDLRLRTELNLEMENAAIIMERLAAASMDTTIEGLRQSVVPASRFSGDLVGALRGDDGSITVMLADVTGHGLASAMLVVPTLQSYRSGIQAGLPLPLLARQMNFALHVQLPAGYFVATMLVRVAPDRRTLSVWNGGLPPACLVDDRGVIVREFASMHLALGILSDDEFDDRCVTMAVDAAAELFGYTDGMPDAVNRDGEQFGVERTMRALQGSAPGRRFDALMRAVSMHVGQRPLHDDISLLAVQVGDWREP
jgi:serine phosphatase RsbU (regulator of sigma subunit)